MVVDELGWPKVQGSIEDCVADSTTQCAGTRGPVNERVGGPSGGTTPRGTAVVTTPAAISARNAASVGRWDRLGLTEVGVEEAVVARSTVVARTVPAIRTAPRPKLRREDAPSPGAWRTGSSRNRREHSARTTEATTSDVRSSGDSGVVAASVAITSIGQCHKYSEYETAPPHCSDPRRSSHSGPDRSSEDPASTTRAVAPTGTSADTPGYAVDASKPQAAARMPPRPSHPTAAATPRGQRCAHGARTTQRPPRPSSHARVKGDRYATVGDQVV